MHPEKWSQCLHFQQDCHHPCHLVTCSIVQFFLATASNKIEELFLNKTMQTIEKILHKYQILDALLKSVFSFSMGETCGAVLNGH